MKQYTLIPSLNVILATLLLGLSSALADFCVKCGSSLPQEAAFCPKCGKKTAIASEKIGVKDDGADRTTSGKPLAVNLNGSVKLELAWIPAGEFEMGSKPGLYVSNNQTPLHHVKITRGFWMAKYEVTQAQYEAVTGKNPATFKGLQNPVECVKWNDAEEFCSALNKMGVLPSGVTARLPSEAEWEYACRAGTATPFYAELKRIAWCNGSDQTTHPVGQKEPNAFGLYDMLGNVFEWCADWDGSYSSNEATDPVGPATGSQRILRGGSWASASQDSTASWRHGCPPQAATGSVGFRICCAQAR